MHFFVFVNRAFCAFFNKLFDLANSQTFQKAPAVALDG